MWLKETLNVAFQLGLKRSFKMVATLCKMMVASATLLSSGRPHRVCTMTVQICSLVAGDRWQFLHPPLSNFPGRLRTDRALRPSLSNLSRRVIADVEVRTYIGVTAGSPHGDPSAPLSHTWWNRLSFRLHSERHGNDWCVTAIKEATGDTLCKERKKYRVIEETRGQEGGRGRIAIYVDKQPELSEMAYQTSSVKIQSGVES